MTRRRVITEREVQRSARAGDSSIDVSGAVVTPSARDAAVRAKIALTGGSAPTHEPSRRPRPQSAARAEKTASPRPAAAAARPARPGAGKPPVPPSAPIAAPGPAAQPAPKAKTSDTGITVAIGADHGGVSMKSIIADRLRELGHTVLDFGTVTKEPVDYPDFAVAVAKAVADGRAAMGVVIDGAGIGSCMAANKVRGARAAMCYDVTTASNAREHNNANILTLGAGLIGSRLATAILDTFLATPFAGGRHKPRVDKIDALDRPG
jgi:ribose 5-phosphate isomerase B